MRFRLSVTSLRSPPIQAQILTAGYRFFAEYGFEGLSNATLADLLHMPLLEFERSYPTKERFFEACLLHYVGKNRSRPLEAFASKRNLGDCVSFLLHDVKNVWLYPEQEGCLLIETAIRWDTGDPTVRVFVNIAREILLRKLGDRFEHANDSGEDCRAATIHFRTQFLMRSMQAVALQVREGSPPDVIDDFIKRAVIACCSCDA